MTTQVKAAIQDAIREISDTYQFEGIDDNQMTDLYRAFGDVMSKHVLPVVDNLKSITKSTGKAPKKSNTPNYYAVFHSLCSEGGKYKVPTEDLPTINFNYQETTADKLNEKQQDIRDRIEGDPDLCEVVGSFSTTNLKEMVHFINEDLKGLKLNQMHRTAFIWHQWVSAEDQKAYKEWHKSLSINDQPRPAIRKPAVKAKATARARKPEPVQEKQPEVQPEASEDELAPEPTETDPNTEPELQVEEVPHPKTSGRPKAVVHAKAKVRQESDTE